MQNEYSAKKSLIQKDRHYHLHTKIPSHIIHTRSSRNHILIQVFQSTQMALVGTIGQVFS